MLHIWLNKKQRNLLSYLVWKALGFEHYLCHFDLPIVIGKVGTDMVSKWWQHSIPVKFIAVYSFFIYFGISATAKLVFIVWPKLVCVTSWSDILILVWLRLLLSQCIGAYWLNVFIGISMIIHKVSQGA